MARAPSQHPPGRVGIADFVLAPRPVDLALLGGRAHYEVVIARLRSARRSVWIATANLKELLIEGPRRSARSRDRFASVLELFDELAARGVELRLLHAALPSRAFRAKFDALPRLVQGGLELRQCPRVHFNPNRPLRVRPACAGRPLRGRSDLDLRFAPVQDRRRGRAVLLPR
jgi:phosphatidylserine/phosphatidylglycerophosphate/cardiolipin synthase-like enzyme